jgi:NAD(P)-dependent dehydrogenase (short-subunit alcohol dehydrogenase family)
MSPPRRLDGLRAVVSGGSRGLGRAICEAYLREGASVVATARTLAHLDGLRRDAEGLPGQLAGLVTLELGDPASVRAAAAEARTVLGRIDVIVNNAAILGERTPLTATPDEDLRLALAINIAGPVALVGALADALSDRAVIINVTSGAAGRAPWGAYGLTKAALNIATQMLAAEMEPRGVRCVAINPGPVRTEMRRAAYPLENPATVRHPRSIVEPFIAIAAGAQTDGVVEASEWIR